MHHSPSSKGPKGDSRSSASPKPISFVVFSATLFLSLSCSLILETEAFSCISKSQISTMRQPSLISNSVLFSSSSRSKSLDVDVDVDTEEQADTGTPLDPEIAKCFTIKTCSSTTCAKRSKETYGLDDYALFSGLYVRKEEASNGDGSCQSVKVEEASCMGRCQFAPCVAIEHEDYEGYIGLEEGMVGTELQYRVFENIVTEDDLDRVWDSVENAIRVMGEEEDFDDDDDYE
jgi:(2Fe-2S) ferredoxin